jgi:hypothetical protein
LGTRSPPLASYLAQRCPTLKARSGRAAFVRIELLLLSAVLLHDSGQVRLGIERE